MNGKSETDSHLSADLAALRRRVAELEAANQSLTDELAERQRTEEVLTQRLITLTRPPDDTADIKFEDLFDLAEIQRIQDSFAAATGVASVITDTHGQPLTQPSNFCYLCQNIIRQTDKGLANCYHSDAVLGRMNPTGPTMQPCLSGGLLDAGASIRAGDRHIANWLIGQVLEDPINEAGLIAYSHEIGANETEFRQALASVTRMSKERFSEIGQALFLIAEQLSRLALQNVQQARYITERNQREFELQSIADFSAALRAAPTRGDMLPVIVNQLLRFMRAAGALLVIHQPALDCNLVVLARGVWSNLTGQHLPLDNGGIVSQVITSGQPYVMSEVEFEAGLHHPGYDGQQLPMACVPLIEQIETIGALSVGRETPFTPREVHLLQAIADIAANALYRVSIFETLEQRVIDRTRDLAVMNERLTQANAALQELDQLKSKFVSDVSHELRTPVTSLSLYVDLLKHGKPEKRDHYVTQLQSQMARLQILINDILDLSRLERNQTQAERGPVEVNSIVEHVAAVQQVAAETAGLELRCVVADDIPPVLAELEYLTRAVTNLVTNAIKYTRSGFVQIQTYVRANRVCVQVSDTGIGIAPDDLPHVFERFYRGKPVAQSTIPGTGLGLSIVKEIVEAHGGTVDVESAPGEGSVFRIWLPIML